MHPRNHHLGSFGMKNGCLRTQSPGLGSEELRREDLGTNHLEKQQNGAVWRLWEENPSRKTKPSSAGKGWGKLGRFCCCLMGSILPFLCFPHSRSCPQIISKLKPAPMTESVTWGAVSAQLFPLPCLPGASIPLGRGHSFGMLQHHPVRGEGTQTGREHCKFPAFS